MNILITGHKDSLNNGNMLMVLGLIEGIKKRHIRASFTLLSDLPEIDRKRYGNIPSFEIISRPWAKQRIGAIFACFTAFAYGLGPLVGKIVTSISGRKLKFCRNSLWYAFNNADIVVDVSGDDLTKVYGMIAPLQVLFELGLAKLFGVKTMLLAQSFGPFDDRFMKITAYLLRNFIDCITLRDEDSFRLWRHSTPQNSNRYYTPDHPLTDLIHLNKMPRATKTSKDGPVIINISSYVIETALRLARKDSDSSMLNNHISSWATFFEHIHEYSGRELVLLPHAFRPGKGNDGYWLNRIRQHCSSELPIKEIKGPLLPCEVCKIVSGGSFIVAARMHLALTSLKCGVPFLSIAYSHKYQQLLPPSISMISPVVFLDKPFDKPLFSVITKHFDSLWDNRQTYQTLIQSYSQEAIRLAEENINFLLMTVNSEPTNS